MAAVVSPSVSISSAVGSAASISVAAVPTVAVAAKVGRAGVVNILLGPLAVDVRGVHGIAGNIGWTESTQVSIQGQYLPGISGAVAISVLPRVNIKSVFGSDPAEQDVVYVRTVQREVWVS